MIKQPQAPFKTNTLTSLINKLPLIKKIRRTRKLKALKELEGLWADKDTSFFDKR